MISYVLEIFILVLRAPLNRRAQMEITPLAEESMGVQSMCTRVQTDDVCIVIDPAVSLVPLRYGLPPNRLEEETKARLRENVKETIVDSGILIINHFHYDHVDSGARVHRIFRCEA